MIALVIGLLLFLGVHSTRIVAEGWRTRTIGRMGEKPWKGVYSVISIVGFVLLVWGYGHARQEAPAWEMPAFMRYVTVVLTLPAFVLLAAAYVPRNSIRAGVHHPMVLGVKVWAFAHLLSAGNVADVLLFGGFLVWSVGTYSAARKRDRAAGTVYPPGTASGSIVCLVVGLVLDAAFLLGLHRWLIGVSPI
jgi:uncharacterized membrane protein